MNYSLHRNSFSYNQRKALKLMVLPTILEMLILAICYSFFDIATIPVTGFVSLSSIIVSLSLISTFIIAIIWYIRGKSDDFRSQFTIINFLEILLTLMLLIGIDLLFSFHVLGSMFYGLVFRADIALILSLFIFLCVNFSIIYFFLTFTLKRITMLLSYLLIGGVLITIITNRETQWWRNHLSFLGTSSAVNPVRFILTLIFSGLILLLLSDCVFSLLKKHYTKKKSLLILQILFFISSLSLGLIGVFPVDRPGLPFLLHNYSAMMLTLSIMISMILSGFLIPEVSFEFILSSYALAAIQILLTGLFMKNQISLTAFELMAFVPSFTWVVSVLNTLIEHITPKQAKIEIVTNPDVKGEK